MVQHVGGQQAQHRLQPPAWTVATVDPSWPTMSIQAIDASSVHQICTGAWREEVEGRRGEEALYHTRFDSPLPLDCAPPRQAKSCWTWPLP